MPSAVRRGNSPSLAMRSMEAGSAWDADVDDAVAFENGGGGLAEHGGVDGVGDCCGGEAVALGVGVADVKVMDGPVKTRPLKVSTTPGILSMSVFDLGAVCFRKSRSVEKSLISMGSSDEVRSPMRSARMPGKSQSIAREDGDESVGGASAMIGGGCAAIGL